MKRLTFVKLSCALIGSIFLLSGCGTDGYGKGILFDQDSYDYEIHQQHLLSYTLNFGGRHSVSSFSFDFSSDGPTVKWVENEKTDKYEPYISCDKVLTTTLVVYFDKGNQYNEQMSKPITLNFIDTSAYNITFFDTDGSPISNGSYHYGDSVSVPAVTPIEGKELAGWFTGKEIVQLGATLSVMEDNPLVYYPLYTSNNGTDGIEYSLDASGNFYCVTKYSGNQYDVIIPGLYNGKPVIEISKNAFYNKPITSVIIPCTVMVIGESAFSSSTSTLNSLTFEKLSSLCTVGAAAFAGCSKLTSIYLSQFVTSVGNKAFYGCSNINIFFGASDSSKVSLYDGGSYSTESWNMLSRPYYWNVRSIEENESYKYFVTFDNQIGVYRFIGSDISTICNLTTIDDMDIFLIATECFNGTSVSEVLIGNNITRLGNHSFSGCTSLTKVTFEPTSKVKSIGYGAFSGCSKLKTILIPISVTSIENKAIYGCSSLYVYFEASDSSKISLYDGGMYSTDSWNMLNRPCYWNVKTLEQNSTYAYSTNNDGTVSIIKYLGSDTQVNISTIDGKNVSYINNNAFANSNVVSVTIGSSVIGIYESAFLNCTSLKTFTFASSSNISSIGYGVFSGCNSLETILFPTSIKTIGNKAFSGCSNVYIFFASMDSSNISLYDGGMYSSDSWNMLNRPVYWNIKKVDKHYLNVNGSFLYFLTNIDTVGIVKWLSSQGPVENDWKIDEVDGHPVTRICSSAFSGCNPSPSGSSYNYITITIGASITKIDDKAFYNFFDSTATGSFYFRLKFESESKLETIGSYAFCSTGLVGNVIIPKSVTGISSYAFGLKTWISDSYKLYMEKGDSSNMSLGEYWNGKRTVVWGSNWSYDSDGNPIEN